MKRRDVLKFGMVGLAAVSLKSIGCSSNPYYVGQDISLNITEALFEMVDRKPVYMWAFQDPNQPDPMKAGPRVPGPLISVLEEEEIDLTITNTLDENHGFRIPSAPGQPDVVDFGTLAPGETKTIYFRAPAAGTYMYFDPLNSPVNRVLGLHGVMVVRPNNTLLRVPYTNPTANVQALFDDLGTTGEFPGHAWDPSRMKIWNLHSIDPRWNAMALAGTQIDSGQFQNGFLPRYFTINGRSGFFSTHDMDTAMEGHVGEPVLVRIVNSGMATHSPHLHANHVYVLAVNSVVQSSVVCVDTYAVRPLDRVDWLIPFQRPPDIPVHPNNPGQLLRIDAAQELGMSFGGVRQSPLDFPMHCHMEMSQTAAGGNYPLGMVTHMSFTGDVDGVLFPHQE
ncbi:MAG: multicopper oxidase domain-containing protein [Thermodesulfovibrionales bacterium]